MQDDGGESGDKETARYLATLPRSLAMPPIGHPYYNTV